ncbi:superoxide dismutase [Dictyostelium discoideum AX4]|uniref:Superoxide dismutase [Cu-Zn] 4 n=1 Tax=Dictyostelium discoideum TaxID=44689 RepID=SODC4_DICDI|nr:superoxide dismutase [Dictyostelium discoideum AX4]Q54TU5.1 RecName: Full=Superoxide dismutase [Cu-Zn] 4 [Dictyostelium discoideum]EAL66728.1 superoxide dismutase [Dictyostelium discoideum AX4]FAA00019.1 TPA: SodD [Dictyostelium discoideum]|eukprot:XP_640716.1 superoxide dismutase [Dictyostelium discoideum AX4]
MVKAICVVKGAVVNGTIIFSQENEGSPVYVNGTISGLSGGLHGFHIHEFGDTSNGCLSAGAHFNPFHVEHGGPNSAIRHVGDLGNITSCPSSKVANVLIQDNVISLFGDLSIIGRTLVVHENQDDLGLGGNLSKTTGNAGARVACGILAKI